MSNDRDALYKETMHPVLENTPVTLTLKPGVHAHNWRGAEWISLILRVSSSGFKHDFFLKYNALIYLDN